MAHDTEDSVKRIPFVILTLAVAASLTGCYFNNTVQESGVGLRLDNGVSISEIVGSGRYTNWGWFADLKVIDVSAKTSDWTDPDLVTKDKQPIGLSVAVTYARKRDTESITRMWQVYRSEATSDESLAYQVLSRIPGAAKTVTTKYTLDQMLGVAIVAAGEADVNRQVVTKDFFDQLQPELNEVGVELLDVRLVNIAPDPAYLATLSEKAQIQLKGDVAKQQTLQFAEQLKQEQKKTEIDLEIASRANKVNEELAKAYQSSPEIFRLKMLELLQGFFGEGDKIYFIPAGSDLDIVVNTGGGSVVPLEAGR